MCCCKYSYSYLFLLVQFDVFVEVRRDKNAENKI